MTHITVDKALIDAWPDEANDDDLILDLHEKWYFEMDINVTNNTESALDDIVVNDDFGGDLEIISVDGVPVDVKTDATPLKGKQKVATYGDVTILWTGKTEKAHLTWDIASLAADTTVTLTVVVSTDVNPGQGKSKDKGMSGKNEYTSGGEHYLNSGPTAIDVIDDITLLFEDNDPITVTVGEMVLT
jgi:hypothetical protein